MRSRISFGIGRSSKLRTIFRLRTTSWNSTSHPPVAIALSGQEALVDEIPAQHREVRVEPFEDAVHVGLRVVTPALEALREMGEKTDAMLAAARHGRKPPVSTHGAPELRIVDRLAVPIIPPLHAATIGAMSRPEVPLRSRLPDRVTIVEVAPRDGLQAERTTVPTEAKLEFIERLVAAGHTVVEATSFVSPEAVPQLADAGALLSRLRKTPGVRYPVLVPNARGLERALEAGVSEVAVFLSASESYSQKNLRRSRAEALEMVTPVIARAKDAGLRVRGYLSMVIADPWDGPTPRQVVVDAGRALLGLGCDELSLGDTTGIGTAADVQRLIRSEEHTSELQSLAYLVCRLLLE